MIVEEWKITLMDGTTEEVTGELRINDGVLWITDRNPGYNIIHGQVAYPLTSVVKWEKITR